MQFLQSINGQGRRLSAPRAADALRCLGASLPLLVLSGAQAPAFPNAGVNLRYAIQEQGQELNEGSGSQAFAILGSMEFEGVEHRFRSKWQRLVKRIAEESPVYQRCGESAADCPPKLVEWRKLLQSLWGLPVKMQLPRLNRAINAMAVYADDGKTFGRQDHWATPLEFFKGQADCEDYAVVKFQSLLELGYGNDQLRFAVVRDERRGQMHAVMTVRVGEQTFVLDSLSDHPVEQHYALKYAPVFSANLDSHWVHIVTRKIRVSYLNQVEKSIKDRTARITSRDDVRRARPKVSPAAKFVDWM